jgi:hypothetical protein
MATAPDNPQGWGTDDWMFGQDTLNARSSLVEMLVARPQIATAKITCDAAPLQIQGELSDGRPYYFRARWGTASLSIAPAGESPTAHGAHTQTTDCTHVECTERADEAVALVGTLLALHGL